MQHAIYNYCFHKPAQSRHLTRKCTDYHLMDFNFNNIIHCNHPNECTVHITSFKISYRVDPDQLADQDPHFFTTYYESIS